MPLSLQHATQLSPSHLFPVTMTPTQSPCDEFALNLTATGFALQTRRHRVLRPSTAKQIISLRVFRFCRVLPRLGRTGCVARCVAVVGRCVIARRDATSSRAETPRNRAQRRHVIARRDSASSRAETWHHCAQRRCVITRRDAASSRAETWRHCAQTLRHCAQRRCVITRRDAASLRAETQRNDAPGVRETQV